MGEGQPRLLDQVRDRIRRKHYSIRTEQAYVDWIRRFILHHNKRHPRDMGAAEVEAFLTHLAVAKRVSASTQNQAKSAILLLYIEAIFAHLDGTVGLMLRLLYGTGMRIMECGGREEALQPAGEALRRAGELLQPP